MASGARPAPASRWAWLGLAVVMLLVGLVRWRLAGMPFERDEGEYGYMGQLMLAGVPPYQEAFNMKFPGTYALYALALAAFGQGVGAVRAFLALADTATAVMLFVLARRLAGPFAGFVAGSTFALMAIGPAFLGPMAHATHFQVCFATAGILAAEAAGRSRHPALLGLLAGLPIGLAVLVKQPGLAFLLPALVMAWQGGWRCCAAVGLGTVLPVAATMGALRLAGVFGTFWFWTVDYARAYAGIVPAARALSHMRSFIWPILDGYAGVLLLALVGLAACLRPGLAGRTRLVVPALFLAGAAATLAGLWLRPHYFISALPGVALAAGVGARQAWDRAREGWRGLRLEPIAGLWLAAVGVQAIAAAAPLLWQPPERILGQFYGFNHPFFQAEKVGRYLKGASRPGDRIFVAGNEPEICFYAGRRAATGFMYWYPLGEPQPYAEAMATQLRREVEAARPAWVVVCRVNEDGAPGSPLARTQAWAEALVAGYRLEGCAPVRAGAPQPWVPGPQAARVPAGLFVYRRP